MSANVTPQAYTYPAVTIQQLVFTAKRWGQFPTITYVNGGTAGSEVVTMDSSFNISIKIQAGTSTNTQIAAALAAAAVPVVGSLAPADLASAAPVGGHASDTPTCNTLVPLAGGVAAAKASLTVGRATITAASTGASGNSTTLQLVGNVPLVIGTVTDGTHLVITSNAQMIVGATITQGVHTCTITTVTDATHLIVSDTTGFTAAAAVSSVVAGGEKVKVTSAAVLVQIQDGVSSWDQIRAAVAASGSAAALMVITSSGRSIVTSVVLIANTILGSATNLAGGLDAAVATTGAVNALTVVANATGVAANGVTVTLTPGGTAGSEAVTHDASGNFQCQIQSGTSTRTQVAAALNGDATFTATYTASVTTGSTVMLAVYQNSLTGAVGPDLLGWYMDNSTTTLTSSFVYFPFGSMAEDFHVKNDEASGSNTVIGSWDGVNNHFIIKATESWDAQKCNRPGIYLKLGTGAPAYRAWTVNR